MCGHIFWQIGYFVILNAAKNLDFSVASARFFAAFRMTELARKFGHTQPPWWENRYSAAESLQPYAKREECIPKCDTY